MYIYFKILKNLKSRFLRKTLVDNEHHTEGARTIRRKTIRRRTIRRKIICRKDIWSQGHFAVRYNV